MGVADENDPRRRADEAPTVLVVEPDPVTRLVVAEFLREAGLAVTEATSVIEARRYVDSGKRADILFSSLDMPGDPPDQLDGQMNGDAFVHLMAEKFPHMIVIVASGNPEPSLTVEFPNLLRKPYQFDQAVRLVFTLLGRDAGDSRDTHDPDTPRGDNPAGSE